MASAFPLLKLGGVLLRICGQPINDLLKRRAANNKIFRERVCIPMGTFYNNYFQRTVSQVTGTSIIPTITAEQAVQLGVEIYGEFLVFLSGGAAVAAQYIRGRKRRKEKDDAQELEINTAKGSVARMETELNAHERNQDRQIATMREEIEELKRILASK